MTDNVVDDYDWQCAKGPHSCRSIIGQVHQILYDLQSKRVADIG